MCSAKGAKIKLFYQFCSDGKGKRERSRWRGRKVQRMLNLAESLSYAPPIILCVICSLTSLIIAAGYFR